MPLEEHTQGTTVAIASKADTGLTTTRSDARLVVGSEYKVHCLCYGKSRAAKYVNRQYSDLSARNGL